MKIKCINKTIFETKIKAYNNKKYFIKIIFYRSTGEIDLKIFNNQKKQIYKNSTSNLGQLYDELLEENDDGLKYHLLNLTIDEIMRRSY